MSRLEGLRKTFRASIIMSDAVTKKLPKGAYHFRLLGRVKVKGKKTGLIIYEVFDGDDPIQFSLKLESKEIFEDGVRKFLYFRME